MHQRRHYTRSRPLAAANQAALHADGSTVAEARRNGLRLAINQGSNGWREYKQAIATSPCAFPIIAMYRYV